MSDSETSDSEMVTEDDVSDVDESENEESDDEEGEDEEDADAESGNEPEVIEVSDGDSDSTRNRGPSPVSAGHRCCGRGAIESLRTTSIFSSLSSLLLSEKYSDMIIRCGGREFKAHRAIVCSQSSFFDKALSSGFSETVTGVIDLPEDDPDVVERFLQFLYTGTYQDNFISTWEKPADVHIMSLDDVADELVTGPGVQVSGDSETEDGDYKSPEQYDEEPEEEYNEFREPGVDESMQQTNDTHTAEEKWLEEVRVRQNLLLPLRLYVMDRQIRCSLAQTARQRPVLSRGRGVVGEVRVLPTGCRRTLQLHSRYRHRSARDCLPPCLHRNSQQ
ncbi:hypothetical protein VTK56DRAFT_10150 [Thermocarpiscus australiensis]